MGIGHFSVDLQQSTNHNIKTVGQIFMKFGVDTIFSVESFSAWNLSGYSFVARWHQQRKNGRVMLGFATHFELMLT